MDWGQIDLRRFENLAVHVFFNRQTRNNNTTLQFWTIQFLKNNDLTDLNYLCLLTYY